MASRTSGKTAGKRKTGKAKARTKKKQSGFLRDEVLLLIILALCILMLLGNFGMIGIAGAYVSGFLFGCFGTMAYLMPVLIFVILAFAISNKNNPVAHIKTGAGVLFILALCGFIQLSTTAFEPNRELLRYYTYSKEYKKAGGFFGGALVKLLCPYLGTIGAYVVFIVLLIICMVLITERSFFKGLKKGGEKVYESAREDAQRRKERSAVRKEEAKKKKELRMDKKVAGVSKDTRLPKKSDASAELHEIKSKMEDITIKRGVPEAGSSLEEAVESLPDIPITKEETRTESAFPQEALPVQAKEEAVAFDNTRNKMEKKPEPEEVSVGEEIEKKISGERSTPARKYEFPPLKLLKKGGGKGAGDSDVHLRETAMKLQQTLKNFGVNVTVTDISCGPSVTRYELQPEMGVKVSKIVGLSDDIKLNLAAADIRIEAPIPGKAAVGIEVPNKENSVVMLRDLLETEEFKKHPSNLAFAAGRDIGGKVVVTDIMKMPHLLIAGSTGSGKSVCINTLIMSILYKANPDDVKLIMIDPKVVELSVYNGIPHLYIPVVTDPKKAAGALNWAVAEMTERYKKFADLNVRDLKGYNEKIASIEDIEDDDKPTKLPQIIIIVDELADLMMVASGEVEESICRLAQLARAAGIHLIIATQRPSVNVITGLIKANMPSRIAFAVSSGVDSRTILDMNGAEKLLGKGDMLFYPQGYQKPVRVQGSFVSDKEVADVVDFLVKQNGSTDYDEKVEEHINSVQVGKEAPAGAPADERDQYFVDAGRLIIEKDKASIGMLQRMFKIGFNRAARIMDQLADAGVVGEEEGTKPRKVLMSMEEFEHFIEEYV